MLARSFVTYNGVSIPAVTLCWTVIISLGVIHKHHPTATEMTYFRSQSIEALSSLHYVISENAPNGTVVADVMNDAGFDRKYTWNVLEQLEFRFVVAPPVGAPLILNRKSGEVRTDGIVDREMIAYCRDREVCLMALDVAVSPAVFFTIVKLSVEISDVNDNAPRFRQTSYTIEVRESTSAGSSFPLPTAVDLDSRLYGIRRYQLDPETDIPELALSVTSRADGSLEPLLIVRHQLDREREPMYRLKLWAIDGGVPSLVASADIVVYVVDSNDHSPVFERSVYTVNITEDIAVGSLVVSTLAIDSDTGLNAVVIYKFSAQTDSLYGRLFTLNNETGDVIVRAPPDREQFSVIQLTIIATDLGPDSSPSDTSVVIYVDDVNDNSPEVTISTLPSMMTSSLVSATVARRRFHGAGAMGTARHQGVADVLENLAPGAFVAHLSVADPDYGDNGRVQCHVINNQMFALTRRHDNEYKLVTTEPLDRESTPSHVIMITCSDHGTPSLTTTRTLTVNVTDVNDNRPLFTQATYTAHLSENNYVGTVIVQLSAVDFDEKLNALFDYVISNVSAGLVDVTKVTESAKLESLHEFFHVNSRGVVSASTIFDRERYSHFRLTVSTVDRGLPAQTGSAFVDVFLDDVNDECPTFKSPDGIGDVSSYMFHVVENETPVGNLIGTVGAIDMDATLNNNRIQYSFSVGQSLTKTWENFVIDPDTGGIFTRSLIDREYQSVYGVKIVAFDEGQPIAMTAVVMVTIHVDDLNDNDPVIEFPLPGNGSLTVSIRTPVGYPLLRIIARDSDSGNNGRLSFSVFQNGGLFRIDQHSGVLCVNNRFTSDADHGLVVVVTDDGIAPRSASVELTVHVDSSIPFPVHAEVGDVTLPPADVVRFVLVLVGGGVLVVMLVTVGLVASRWRHEQCHVTGREKQQQRRLAILEMLKSDGGVERTSEPDEKLTTQHGETRRNSKMETAPNSFGPCSDFDVTASGFHSNHDDVGCGCHLAEMTSHSSSTTNHVTTNHSVSGRPYSTLPPLASINLGGGESAEAIIRRPGTQRQRQQSLLPATFERRHCRAASSHVTAHKAPDNTINYWSSARDPQLGHVHRKMASSSSWISTKSQRLQPPPPPSLSNFDLRRLESTCRGAEKREDAGRSNNGKLRPKCRLIWMIDPDLMHQQH